MKGVHPPHVLDGGCGSLVDAAVPVDEQQASDVLAAGCFTVICDPLLSPSLKTQLVNDTYESAEISLVSEIISSGDRTIEFGSGIGLVTMHLAARTGDTRVRSFEANPRLARLAIENGRRNGFRLDIVNQLVVAHNKAAAKPFFLNQNFLASSSVRRSAVDEEIAVPVVEMGSAIRDFEASALVVDVEGAERDLADIGGLGRVEVIIVEMHPDIIGSSTCAGLLRYLTRCGFRLDQDGFYEATAGLVHVDRGRTRTAAPLLDLQVATGYLEALTLAGQGQHGYAAQELVKACRLAPAAVGFRLKLAETLLRAGEPALACSTLHELDRDQQLDDRGLHFLAIAELRANRTDRAFEALERLSSVAAERPSNQLLRARIALRSGELSEAQMHAESALARCPWNVEYGAFLEQVMQRRSEKSSARAGDVHRTSTALIQETKMREIVLHIGLPKTATSTIQRWLTSNAKQLRQRGIWVPSRQILAHRLAAETITNPTVKSREDVERIRETAFTDAIEALAEAATTPRFRKLVVSSEYFYEAAPETVRDRVTSVTGLPTRIVVALRRQDRLVESGYNQSVKAMGMTVPVVVPRYLHELDWCELVKKWASVFGPTSITVLNYDSLAQRRRVLEGFLETIDSSLARDAGSAEFTPVKSVNESLPADLLEFKRIANILGEFGLDRWLYRLVEAGHKGPAFRITGQTARGILDLYRESNDRLARDVLRIPGPLFDELADETERDGADLYGQLPVETLATVVAFFIRETDAVIRSLQSELAELRNEVSGLNRNSSANSPTSPIREPPEAV